MRGLPPARFRTQGDFVATLVIHDETAAGRPVSTMTLPDLPSTVTVRELVRLRVREEVARHNAAPARLFSGLVKPVDAEVAANGYQLKTARRLDWERQADVAEEAFSRNGYFILVGDRQVEDLDEVVDLDADPHVAFVKLTPLVGG
jgi:hypothetical protein